MQICSKIMDKLELKNIKDELSVLIMMIQIIIVKYK